MGRKAEVMEATSGALDGVVAIKGVVALNRDEPDAQDSSLKEQVLFTGSSDWTPEEAEHYIDRRIQLLDLEIGTVRERLDDLIGTRKRWLSVTGGRSKAFTSGNGHNGTNGS